MSSAARTGKHIFYAMLITLLFSNIFVRWGAPFGCPPELATFAVFFLCMGVVGLLQD